MQNPIVKVHQGQLRGVSERNLNGMNFISFRGIPYAKPPIGNLRFKDCEPPESWSGIRDAIKFGERCAQQDWFTRATVGGDDCLNLNIYTPNLNTSIQRAVMVWIHGGAFMYGSNRDDLYGPDYLIDKGIVLVTINYRLGILGFLNVDDEEAPGNQGLKDQVQALKWIQQNIAQFGGDPNNVTICGDSAGGACVHFLTISPLAQGLFHKAIIHSGSALCPWASSPETPMESVKKLAEVLNEDCSDVKKFVAYLRTLDIRCLIEAVVKIQSRQDKILNIHPFLPSVDSKAKNPFLSIPIGEAAKVGIKVPCICGFVSHEGMIIFGALTSDMIDEINENPENLLIHPTVLRYLKKYNLTVNDIKQYYFGNEKISSKNPDKFIKFLNDIYVRIDLHRIIEIQSKFPDAPIYLYKFEYELEISLLKKCLSLKLKGSCHGDELSFLFHQKFAKCVGKKPPTPGSLDYLIIQRFTGMWTNFAKTGNPTPQSTYQIPVEWEPIDDSNEYKCLHITKKLTMSTETNAVQELRKRI